MSIAREHSEWLSLVDQSGPFLSVPVLMRAFPQGLDKLDSAVTGDLRLAYEEWQQDQRDPAIHTAWVRFVLGQLLEFPAELIAEGQTLPPGLRAVVSEQSEVLRPDLAITQSSGQSEASKPHILIQVYQPSQKLESAVVGKHWKASPATRMMELLHATEVPLGLVTNGEQWMLVFAPRNETTGYTSWYASLWLEEQITLRAFASLLSVRRFFGVAETDTILALLFESSKNQQEVTDQLGLQVRQAVEVLVQSFDRLDQDSGRTLLKGTDEKKLYEAALTVMMRLVFLFSAEERKLMPIDEYALYAQSYAVSNLGALLRETADKHGEEILERSFDAWSRLLATFRAVFAGVEHDAMRLPPYGGNLFDPDRFKFLEGRPSHGTWRDTEAQPPRIDNRTVLHLLEALQWLEVRLPGGGPKEKRRLSFRALDIEQIGHVYEGLLDHTAVRASEPVLGLTGAKGQEPEISLRKIEQSYEKGINTLVEFLKEETGRSEKALRKGITEPALIDEAKLRVACRNDADLMAKVRPFAALIREDTFGYPVVITEGSVYVTSGTDRRSSGTHYTPRSLTEPIVQHTLEPLVYVGPAEGKPKEDWELKSPRELLELKICDMAMGSGAFLVQACRYLSERLLEAWETAQKDLGDNLQITPEGERAEGVPEERLVPADEDERRAIAMRIVAERCLYGVDNNPLAVEMAKLSLWLITLSKGKPFTFLNHALKCGDSLVGADEKMFLEWAHGGNKNQITTFDARLEKVLSNARSKRKELESFEAKDVRDAERKADLLVEAELAMEWVKLGCNLLIGAKLLQSSDKDSELQPGRLLSDYLDSRPLTSMEAVRALDLADKVRAFHWPFEFPEVFERGGFDAFIGNPPFMWGNRISTILGDHYRDWLLGLHKDMHGNADLCAHFFRRAHDLSSDGNVGLIATNSICETDNRVSTLLPILADGCNIYWAISNTPWPGQAGLHVAVIVTSHREFNGPVQLDGREVESISSFLDDKGLTPEPEKLAHQSNMSFKGVDTGGLGFVVLPEEAQEIRKSSSQSEQFLWPLLNGDDFLNHPAHKPSRLIINFSALTEAGANAYPMLMAIVKDRVLPYRKTVKRKANRENWWLYNEPRPGLYNAIAGLKQVLINCVVSKHVCFGFVPARVVFTNALNVFATDSAAHFALLQSTFHESWARHYGSSLDTRNRYNPTDCFETFPFPTSVKALDQIGSEYLSNRQSLLQKNNEGLTSLYNRFHNSGMNDSGIEMLRELHVAMDRMVLRSYGWDDLELDHGWHETEQGLRYTLGDGVKKTVLKLLLQLNQSQYEQERIQGLHEKEIKRPTGARSKKNEGVGNEELPL